MLATKRIPVTEAVWIELSELKSAGQTYSQLLEEMIEERKKARLFRDMEKIEKEGEFVELPWRPSKKNDRINPGSKVGHDPVLIDLSLFQAG